MPKLALRAGANDEGYVSAEALMASIILATALAFGLVAFIKARQITDASLQLRRATALAQAAMAVHLTTIGESSGQTPALSWRMELENAGRTGRISICRRAIHIQDRSETPRRYEASALQTCPTEAAL